MRCLEDTPEERISAEEALNHPALTANISISRADTILLPSPVLSFTSGDPAHLRAVQDHLLPGQVIEQRTSGNQLFVQFRSVRESIRAKSVLSCEGVRNIDLASNDEIIIYKRRTTTPQTICYKTEFFPLDLWYKMDGMS